MQASQNRKLDDLKEQIKDQEQKLDSEISELKSDMVSRNPTEEKLTNPLKKWQCE